MTRFIFNTMIDLLPFEFQLSLANESFLGLLVQLPILLTIYTMAMTLSGVSEVTAVVLFIIKAVAIMRWLRCRCSKGCLSW